MQSDAPENSSSDFLFALERRLADLQNPRRILDEICQHIATETPFCAFLRVHGQAARGWLFHTHPPMPTFDIGRLELMTANIPELAQVLEQDVPQTLHALEASGWNAIRDHVGHEQTEFCTLFPLRISSRTPFLFLLATAEPPDAARMGLLRQLLAYAGWRLEALILNKRETPGTSSSIAAPQPKKPQRVSRLMGMNWLSAWRTADDPPRRRPSDKALEAMNGESRPLELQAEDARPDEPAPDTGNAKPEHDSTSILVDPSLMAAESGHSLHASDHLSLSATANPVPKSALPDPAEIPGGAERLARLNQDPEAEREVRRLLASEEAEERKLAVLLVANGNLVGSLPHLALHLFDPSPDVAELSARTLRYHRHSKHFAPVEAVVNSRIDLQDPDIELAILAARRLRARRCLPALINLLDAPDYRESAREALLLITLNDPGDQRSDWQTWFEAHGHDPEEAWYLTALEQSDVPLARRAVEELEWLAGQSLGSFDLSVVRERNQAKSIWEQWLKDRQKNPD